MPVEERPLGARRGINDHTIAALCGRVVEADATQGDTSGLLLRGRDVAVEVHRVLDCAL
jgi:hypothetical protein